MKFFTKKKILVTHNGTFHADDIFATAIISILHNGNIKVIRTRDEEILKTADYVYDVGGVYDPLTNRFDHHQVGGAGVRENEIPYAACGLVWKTYGEKICGGKEVADRIDQKLIQPLDANDNGVNTFEVKESVVPYCIWDIIFAFRPSYKEGDDYDTPFISMVAIAIQILKREISKTQDSVASEAFVRSAYENAKDKRLILLDDHYPWGEVISSYPEPLYVVSSKVDTWRVECVRKEKNSFENRKSLPLSWAGLRDEKMAEVSGVPDAIFCHNGRFMAVARSKEGALALANKALSL